MRRSYPYSAFAGCYGATLGSLKNGTAEASGGVICVAPKGWDSVAPIRVQSWLTLLP